MKDLTTEQLKDELTRRGYYTGNLWHIDDVKIRFEATDDEAQDVLDEVLQEMTVPRKMNLKKKMKPFEYITLALYVIAFKVVDKIGEYKQRKVTEKWNN